VSYALARMSDPEPPPPPPEPSPQPPSPQPAAPPETQTQKLARLRQAFDARAKRVARVLLHARYVFGYLAAGFLVSVPISLGSRIGYGIGFKEALENMGLSVTYGILLLIPFFVLIPFSRIDWKGMRVPEFQLFELAVTRHATWVGFALCLVFYQLHAFTNWVEPSVAWTVAVLMLFAWGRIKVNVLLFPEFYKEEEKASA